MTFLTRNLNLCFSSPVHTEGAAARATPVNASLTNATPDVVAEKGERSEKLYSKMDVIGEYCDVDVGLHQSEVSSDEGGGERDLSEHKGALKRGCIEARVH